MSVWSESTWLDCGWNAEHPEDRAEAPDPADADQAAGEEDNLLLQAGENAYIVIGLFVNRYEFCVLV
jgi:hypothetical protein